jgi:hypothetical protein
LRARSMRAAHEAQVIPSMARSTWVSVTGGGLSS